MSSTPVAGPSESDASDAEQVYYDPLVFKGSNLAELTVNIALRARKPPRAHLKASHAQTCANLAWTDASLWCTIAMSIHTHNTHRCRVRCCPLQRTRVRAQRRLRL